jgi:hypothetical protein
MFKNGRIVSQDAGWSILDPVCSMGSETRPIREWWQDFADAGRPAPSVLCTMLAEALGVEAGVRACVYGSALENASGEPVRERPGAPANYPSGFPIIEGGTPLPSHADPQRAWIRYEGARARDVEASLRAALAEGGWRILFENDLKNELHATRDAEDVLVWISDQPDGSTHLSTVRVWHLSLALFARLADIDLATTEASLTRETERVVQGKGPVLDVVHQSGVLSQHGYAARYFCAVAAIELMRRSKREVATIFDDLVFLINHSYSYWDPRIHSYLQALSPARREPLLLRMEGIGGDQWLRYATLQLVPSVLALVVRRVVKQSQYKFSGPYAESNKEELARLWAGLGEAIIPTLVKTAIPRRTQFRVAQVRALARMPIESTTSLLRTLIASKAVKERLLGVEVFEALQPATRSSLAAELQSICKAPTVRTRLKGSCTADLGPQ